jgi:hypothetical protein
MIGRGPVSCEPSTGSASGGPRKRCMPRVRSLYLVSLVQVEVLIAVIGVKREPYEPCLAERLLRDYRPQTTAALMFRRPRKSPSVLVTKSLAP